MEIIWTSPTISFRFITQPHLVDRRYSILNDLTIAIVKQLLDRIGNHFSHFNNKLCILVKSDPQVERNLNFLIILVGVLIQITNCKLILSGFLSLKAQLVGPTRYWLGFRLLGNNPLMFGLLEPCRVRI